MKEEEANEKKRREQREASRIRWISFTMSSSASRPIFKLSRGHHGMIITKQSYTKVVVIIVVPT